MKKIILLMTLLSTFAVAQTNDGNSDIGSSDGKTLEGFPGECVMFLANGNPVLEIKLYADAETAQKNKTSIQKPVGTAILDAGPGYQVAKLHTASKVRKICNSIAEKSSVKAVLQVDSKNVVKQITQGSETIASDAYLLMPQEQRAVIESLVRAYIVESNK